MLNNRKKLKLFLMPNMVGLISIMLVLLFLFIGQTQNVHPMPSVDLAKVEHPWPMHKADREDAIIVAIKRDGSVFFGFDKVTMDRLPALIREGVKNGAEKKVYIKADARTKHGNVEEVVDAVRSAGIENIAFLVEERRNPVSPK